MFLPKDHAAFEIDRKRLAVWTDIRHLQWGFAQRRECRELRQHGRTLQRKWLALFYLGLTQIRGICCPDSTQSSRIWRHATVAGAGELQIESPFFCERSRTGRAVVPIGVTRDLVQKITDELLITPRH